MLARRIRKTPLTVDARRQCPSMHIVTSELRERAQEHSLGSAALRKNCVEYITPYVSLQVDFQTAQLYEEVCL